MEINKKKIIGVEGKDEINFFEALFKSLNIRDIQLINFGGKDNFNNKIKQIVKLANFKDVTHFGLIRDADDDYSGALASVKASLKNANLPVPEENQNFSSVGVPKTGIFIMPGGNKTGMLESLCIDTIREDIDFQCVKNYIDCISEKPNNEDKAIIQVYLAGKNPIVNSLGLGALKGHIDFESAKLQTLKDFIWELRN